MQVPDAATRPRVFYGWIVVWAAFAGLAMIFGTAYSFAAFFQPWSVEFDAQRADVSWVFGLSSLDELPDAADELRRIDQQLGEDEPSRP
mgnify:CR=1 FL=1